MPSRPRALREGNVNGLTDLQRYDSLSGFPCTGRLLCDSSKVEDEKECVDIGSGENDMQMDITKGLSTPVPEKERIYLDHNATTYLDPEVMDAIIEYARTQFGNPSSIYREGKAAKDAIEQSRRSLAQLLNCTAKRILFTGCCTEANNFIIKGLAFAHWGTKQHIITTRIEHSSVLEPCKWLEKFGYRVTYLPVDRTGRVDPNELDEAITPETLLVSIMTANNETGTIQPISELGMRARKHGVLFHTDATQAIGKIPIDIKALDVDFLSLSAHKIYGPKGVGACYIKNGIDLDPLLHGGEQEEGIRAGTENTIGIVGLGKAAETARRHLEEMDRIRALRDKLETALLEMVPGSWVNGHPVERLPNTLNMTFPGYRGESIVLALDRKGISISSGSACHSGSPAPSHVLLAMGLSEEEVHCSVRISLGMRTTEDEIDRTISIIDEIIHEQEQTVRFVACG